MGDGDFMSNGITSTRYESWIANLKAVQGTVRKRIMGAFARVLGDKTVEWMTQVNLEHLPGFASDPSVALIASERQLDFSAAETATAIGARAPYWIKLAKFRGRPLGMLLGLHFFGADTAAIIQQNGKIYTLTLPLPAFGDPWDPTPSLSVANASALLAPLTSVVNPTRSIPAGTPWFDFDGNTDFTSRFAVVFQSWPFAALAFATFNNSDFATVTWPFGFGGSSYFVVLGDAPAMIILNVDGTTKTGSGCTIRASAQWTGVVPIIAWTAGVNPFNFFSADTLANLKNLILKWKPAKSTCMGVFALMGGEMWDYPTGLTWDGDSNTWDGTAVSTVLSGAF